MFQQNGSYGYRIDIDPSTGNRRQSSRQGYCTTREAEGALRAALDEVARGIGVNRSSLDLGATPRPCLIGAIPVFHWVMSLRILACGP
ncbi:MAG: Arm DNA-binding domain-containing protein [Acidimicrobiales bacterium]